ncbi:hypothetical protein CLIB1444_20S00672 [[Candida] jaroonii]|uniref:Uncharacterized protein n=1 Tax=[Candida] jaroonii TaxID=467808 RepID=A0ACA9YFB0_9ASCO|nr:hypothetical protein CLIB1444_20S00672 [[Candida] jaroonii]
MDPSKRIISHMNKGHQISIVDYLVVYGNVKLSELVESSAQISAINEKSMDITYFTKSNSKQTKTFKWKDIPEDDNVTVKDMSDLKAKLVSMAKYAASKQGYSHVQVTEYPRLNKDTALMTSLLAICIIGLYDMRLLKRLLANDPITSSISPYFPAKFWNLLGSIERNFKSYVAGLYAIHIGEIVYYTIPNMIRFRVPFPQSVAWCGLHFIEGFLRIIQFRNLKSAKGA